jgi:hypothetical protein
VGHSAPESTPKRPNVVGGIISLFDKIRVKFAIKNLESDKKQERAIRTLVRIGKPAVEPLIAALSGEYGSVRLAATEALSLIDDPQAQKVSLEAQRKHKEAQRKHKREQYEREQRERRKREQRERRERRKRREREQRKREQRERNAALVRRFTSGKGQLDGELALSMFFYRSRGYALCCFNAKDAEFDFDHICDMIQQAKETGNAGSKSGYDVALTKSGINVPAPHIVLIMSDAPGLRTGRGGDNEILDNCFKHNNPKIKYGDIEFMRHLTQFFSGDKAVLLRFKHFEPSR